MEPVEANLNFIEFLLAVFAVWRLSHLISREDGPWNTLLRLRVKLGRSGLGSGMDCFYCVSLWVSTLLAVLITASFRSFILVSLGISGITCVMQLLIDRSTEK